MQIDKDTIHRIAHLARLDFDEREEEKVRKDLMNILTWMEQLHEINTDDIEPLTHMSAELNILREDIVKEPLSHDRGLFNAPKKDSDYFRVPKVIE